MIQVEEIHFEENQPSPIRRDRSCCWCSRGFPLWNLRTAGRVAETRFAFSGKADQSRGGLAASGSISDEQRYGSDRAPFARRRKPIRRYLKTLPPDRLLHTFRLTAGLPSSAEPLGDWEKPDCELRGHFAGGHYLSACALAFASSGDEDLSAMATSWWRGTRKVPGAARTAI